MATERDIVAYVVSRGLNSLTLTPSGNGTFLKPGELIVKVRNIRNEEWPALFKEGERYRIRFERLGDDSDV